MQQRHGPDKSSGPVSGNVTIDGSATVLPLSKAIAAAFRKSNPTVQFAIALSGTGGGFKKFCAGGIDIEDASRPIKADESEQCKAQHIEYIELPVAFDSLSVVVNAKNTFVDCLTVKELKAIWEPAAEGRMSQWNQIRASFPAQPLLLFGPGKASGTFDYFTFAIVGNKAAAGATTPRAKTIRSSSKGSRLSRTPRLLRLRLLPGKQGAVKRSAVDNGHGCVLPSTETSRRDIPAAVPAIVHLCDPRLPPGRRSMHSCVFIYPLKAPAT